MLRNFLPTRRFRWTAKSSGRYVCRKSGLRTADVRHSLWRKWCRLPYHISVS